MKLSDMRSQIQSGKFDNFYLMAVEDGYVAKAYIKMIAKKTGYRVVYEDSILGLGSKLKVHSLIGVPNIYVIVNDKDFTKSDNEKIWDSISSQIDSDIVIMEYFDVDRRIKFWKHFKDRAVEVPHMESRIFKKHIQQESDLTDDEADLLMELCEQDYGRCLLEIDKINRSTKSLKELIKDGTIYVPPKDAIFDFTDAVLARKPKKALDYLSDCEAINEPNMRLISVLYNNFRSLLQVQTVNQSSIAKSTGLTGWQIKNVKKHIDNYSDEELIDILRLLRSVERGIKIGEIEDTISVQYCLANIF